VITWAAGAVVVACGLFLLAFAVAMLTARAASERFLRKFASSARAHYAEQTLRLVAGAAFVLFASEMRYPLVFQVFGWILVVTAAVLMLLPWRWHQRFGAWAIPLAIRHMRLYAVGALALGGFVLWAAF
jgi:hypothetical protein